MTPAFPNYLDCIPSSSSASKYLASTQTIYLCSLGLLGQVTRLWARILLCLRLRSCRILPDMAIVTAGGSIRVMATRTFSSCSSLHLIIDSFAPCCTSLIAAFSAAIVPKNSEKRFVIALTELLDPPACIIET